jgi:hypothetical protein
MANAVRVDEVESREADTLSLHSIAARRISVMSNRSDPLLAAAFVATVGRDVGRERQWCRSMLTRVV